MSVAASANPPKEYLIKLGDGSEAKCVWDGEKFVVNSENGTDAEFPSRSESLDVGAKVEIALSDDKKGVFVWDGSQFTATPTMTEAVMSPSLGLHLKACYYVIFSCVCVFCLCNSRNFNEVA